jgi:hypothetical protein
VYLVPFVVRLFPAHYGRAHVSFTGIMIGAQQDEVHPPCPYAVYKFYQYNDGNLFDYLTP